MSVELTNDSAGNVTGAIFNCTLGGKTQAITLKDLTLASGGPVTTADLAPIVAFELNLVGPGDLKHATSPRGPGTFSYSATNFMTPFPSLPKDVVADPVTTGET